MDTKKCMGKIGCGEIKPISCFSKNKYGKYGLSSQCKECNTKYSKKYANHNKKEVSEYKAKYYRNNKEKILDNSKQYYKNNKKEVSEYKIKYYIKNKEYISKCIKKNYQANKNKINRAKIERGHTDINYKIAVNLRKRLNTAIKNKKKVGSAVNDIGCSIEFLKQYLASKFYPNKETKEMMTWENYGKPWHIDHIIPLSSFNLVDKEQFLKACHYTNLQPMWAKENLSKGAKILDTIT
jgi:hypothetical protein